MTPEEAIARYDRYLVEFLEPLNICPWSRRARESGRLARAVCDITEPDVTRAVESMKAVTAAGPEILDVAVLIFPNLPLEWSPFNRFVAKVRDVFTPISTPPRGFYLVAMHPEAPLDLTTPERAVGFMRRTPSPSIQIARTTVIEDARKNGGGNFQESTSDRVARLGLESVQKFGVEKALKLLEDIRHGR